MENSPLAKFIGNYIKDLIGEDIDDVSFLLFPSCLCKQSLCPYNKKKIMQWLEDMNFILLTCYTLS